MITHVNLIGSAAVVAEVRVAPFGDSGDTLALAIGPALVVHLSLESAEAVAEAIIDAVTTRADVVHGAGGPTAYLPGWAPV